MGHGEPPELPPGAMNGVPSAAMQAPQSIQGANGSLRGATRVPEQTLGDDGPGGSGEKIWFCWGSNIPTVKLPELAEVQMVARLFCEMVLISHELSLESINGMFMVANGCSAIDGLCKIMR